MTIRFKWAAVAAVATSLVAGAADAASYTLSKTDSASWFPVDPPVLTGMKLDRPFSPVRTVESQIGGYALTGTETTSGETWEFVAWCVDLFVPFTRNGLNPEVGTFTTSTIEPLGLASETRFNNVESLFERAWSDDILSDPVLAAGWQLAIWELLYERGPTTGYSLTTGQFEAFEDTRNIVIGGKLISSSQATEMSAWEAADGFLAEWNAWTTGDAVSDFDFTYFTNTLGINGSQTLLTFTPAPPAVPLPAPALLLVGGLAALGALRRRRA